MMKSRLLEYILTCLCVVALAGCAYPVDVFRPESSIPGDHEQGNMFFTHRDKLDLTFITYYTKEGFYIYIEYYTGHKTDYKNRQIQIDATKIKIVDQTGKDYLPTAIYEVSEHQTLKPVGGIKIDGATDFTLENESFIRMEFPLSILELVDLQIHTGILGDKTLEAFTIKRIRALGTSGGMTEGDVH